MPIMVKGKKMDIMEKQDVVACDKNADWHIEPPKIPRWKFFLHIVYKANQLDYIQRRGNTLTVAVNSGKVRIFDIGELSVTYDITNKIRDFHFKSTTNPGLKVCIRETDFQMNEEQWDDLADKLNATESSLSKVTNTVMKTAGIVQDIFG